MNKFQLLEIVRQAAYSIVCVIDDYYVLKQENKELKVELQKYKDMIYKQANAPSPHLGWIEAMLEGKVTLNSNGTK